MINPSAIVFDVDGTLISDEKVILLETKDAVRDLYRRFGVKILLASARSPKSLRLICTSLSIDCGLVCFNGALSFPHQTDAISQATTCDFFDGSVCAKILAVLRSLDITISIFTSDLWIANRRDYWLEREIRGTGVEPDLVKEDLRSDLGMLSVVHKILFRGEPDVIRSVRAQILAATSGTCNVFSDRATALEITPVASSKYVALMAVLDKMQISPGQVLVFGDADNDLEMISNFPNSVAMGSGSGKLKQSARFVIGGNNEPSIAGFLRRYTQLSVEGTNAEDEPRSQSSD